MKIEQIWLCYGIALILSGIIVIIICILDNYNK